MRILPLQFEVDEVEDAVRVSCPVCSTALLVGRDGWRDQDGCECTRFLWIEDDIVFFNEDWWRVDEFVRDYDHTLSRSRFVTGRLDYSFLGLPDFSALATINSEWIDAVLVLEGAEVNLTLGDAPFAWAVGSRRKRRRKRRRIFPQLARPASVSVRSYDSWG